MHCYFKTLTYETSQNNLADVEPKLVPYLSEFDYFSIHDLTDASRDWVRESGIRDGLLTCQVHHTTCLLAVNELDEPCLLGDINCLLRDMVPRNKPYLHNSKIRTKNLSCDDKKCDRNADAHMKSFMCNGASQTLIVKDGVPLYGQWQKLCLIDLDGPRERKITVQIMGE